MGGVSGVMYYRRAELGPVVSDMTGMILYRGPDDF
jgi:hypothetical protein